MKKQTIILGALALFFVVTSGVILRAHAALTFSSTTITGTGGVMINGSTTIIGNATTTGNLTVLGSLLDPNGNAYVTSTSGGSVGNNIIANTLSASTTDGSANILGFNINNIVSLSAFGCKGDGVTDDAPCIRAAYAYLVAHFPNGGTIQGDPTAHYFLDSSAPTHVGCAANSYFCMPANNITFKDMYVVSGGLGDFTFENHFEYGGGGLPALTFYPIQSINRGDNTITLTNAGDASNFTVGDLALIRETSTTDPWNYEVQNQITAISGGVLTFQYPFDRSFNINVPEIADVQNQTTFNQTFDNVTVMLGAGDSGPIEQGSANITMDNVDLEQTSTSALAIEGWNQVYGSHITNSKFVTQNCHGGGSEAAGGAGSSHSFIENDNFIMYGCATSATALEGGEGTQDMHIIGNTIVDLDPGSLGLDLSATHDVTVANNTIYVSASSTDPVVTYNGAPGVDPQCTDCTITGNVITGPVGATSYSKSINDLWTGNTFYNSKLYLYDQAVVSGNYFYTTTGTSLGPIILNTNSSSLSSDITGNTIMNTGAVAGNGIYVSDPGSVSTYPLTITGNVITGFTNPVLYVASATIDLPNRVVQGNSGVTDYRGDAISFAVPTATSTYPLSVSGTIALFGTGNGIKFPDGTFQSTANGGGATSSQWTTSTVNLYYNLGNVGLGTTAPSAELTLGTGRVEVPNGAAATPAYSFNNATNTGLYSSIASTLQFVIAGANAAEMENGAFQFEARSIFIDNASDGYEIGAGSTPAEGVFSPGIGEIEIASGSTANANGTLLANAIGMGIGTSTPSTTLQVAGTMSTVRVGISGLPGCVEMYDTINTTTLEYIYPSNGLLVETSTKPTNCQ